MIKNLINKIKLSEFVKNVFTLLSGSAFGQAFLFIIMPLLTRIYSEELFGAYFVFVSSLNILKNLTSLRLELSILMPKKDFWAINAFALTIFSSMIINLLLSVLIILFNSLLKDIEAVSAISKYFLLLPATAFVANVYNAFVAWNNRKKLYKKITTAKISYSTFLGISQITLNFSIFKNAGLIFGNVIGYIISTILIILLTFKSIFVNIKDISLKRMKILLIRYKKIPTFNTLINFFSNISNEIPIYLLTGFYSSSVAGFYGMANKLAGTPVDLLCRSITMVFYQKLTERNAENGNLQDMIKKIYKKLLRTATLYTLGIVAVLPFLHLILGVEWSGIWLYMIIILPPIVLNLAVNPVLSVPTVLNKQNYFFLLIVASTVLKISAISVGFFVFSSPIISLILFSAVTLLFRVFLMFWILKISAK